MKKKHRCACPVCAGAPNHTLSDEAAVEIHEFLEVFIASFMARYGQQICRHYAKRAKRHRNDQQPWENSDESF